MQIPSMGTAGRIVGPNRGEGTYFATTEQQSASIVVSWTRIHFYKTTKYLHCEKHNACVRACARGMMEAIFEKRIEYIRDGYTPNAHINTTEIPAMRKARRVWMGKRRWVTYFADSEQRSTTTTEVRVGIHYHPFVGEENWREKKGARSAAPTSHRDLYP